MKMRNIVSIVLSLLLMNAILFSVMQVEDSGQEKGEKKLSLKYRAFLEETRLTMHPDEKEQFFKLKSDEERDKFINAFWKSRRGRKRRVRDNIRTLMLLRMTQVLELTEEQTAKIFPVVTRVEKQKMAIYVKIGKEMRELRQVLKSGSPDEKEILGKIENVKELRDQVRSKDKELETYLEENLTVIQKAKYLIFAADFNRDLRDQLNRARMMKERLQKRRKQEPNSKK